MFPDPLQEAIDLISRKQFDRARVILETTLEQDPYNEHAWLWLAECEANLRRRRYCLQRALLINPLNSLVRERLAEIKDRVDEPTLDDLLASPGGPVEPTTDAARQARQLLVESSDSLKTGRKITIDEHGAPAPEQSAPRCQACHHGYLLPQQIKHSSRPARTMIFGILGGLVVLMILILIKWLFALMSGTLLMLTDWFYLTPWQPVLALVSGSLAAFFFFRWYLNRTETVLQCTHCGQQGKK